MNRLLFEKTGEAVYISHLDLMRIFQRAFRRADIMIWHSQGFSPRAYVSIAMPLSVGASSRCEILDFEVEDGSVDLRTLPQKLNRTLPAGVRVLRAYESDRKIKHLKYLRAAVRLEYDGGVPDGAQAAIAALFSEEHVLVHKRTKRGETDRHPAADRGSGAVPRIGAGAGAALHRDGARSRAQPAAARHRHRDASAAVRAGFLDRSPRGSA